MTSLKSFNLLTPSAPGLDHFAYQDPKLLAPLHCTYVAEMLNLVEQGAPWPQGLLHTKAALLPKDPDEPYDPLPYRVISVLPGLYRKWATLRLAHKHPWINSWALPNMFSGRPGVGAEDTWYTTAIDLELAHVEHAQYAGAT